MAKNCIYFDLRKIQVKYGYVNSKIHPVYSKNFIAQNFFIDFIDFIS